MKIKTTPINLGAKGHFSLHVHRPDGSEIVEKRVSASENVVTYEGAYHIFFSINGMGRSYNALLGTSAEERTRNSIGLGNLAHTSSQTTGAGRSGVEVDNGDGTSTLTLVREIAFPLSGTIGTFSEVGIQDGSTFIAGQLIKDELGSPTTITILNEEQLKVTYTLLLTVPNGEAAVAPIVATGAVSTPDGTTDYTLYSQPFFREFSIGRSSFSVRYPTNRIGFVPPDGTAFASRQGTINTTLSAGGNVISTLASGTVAPSDFNRNDLTFISFGSGTNYNKVFSAVDPVSRYGENRISDGQNGVYLVAEFSPPLNKNADRSLSIEIETTYTI